MEPRPLARGATIQKESKEMNSKTQTADALVAQGIRVGYGDGAEVLHGIDLTARAGEVTTLIGPNGCGK